MMTAAAGWYADPTDASSVRWWDGERWTAETRPAPQAPAPAVHEAAAVQQVAESAYERELVGAGVGSSGAALAASAVYAHAEADSGPVPSLEPRHTPPAPVTAFAGTTVSTDSTAVPSLAPAPAPAVVAPVMAQAAPVQAAFAPEPEPEVDRSRPGAPLPEDIPVARPTTSGYAAPLDVSALPPSTAAPSHVVRPGFTGAPLGGAAAFNVMSSSTGMAGEPASGHAIAYRQPSHWKRTLVVTLLVLAVLAAGAAVGVPRFLDSKAAAAAESAPQIVPAKAPAAYAGVRRSGAPTTSLSALAARLRSDGAPWAWSQGYHSNDATTLVLAASLGSPERALAYRALTDHTKAMDLVNGVVADVSSGTRDVPGQPVQYLSPVGGSIWCLPYASDGIGGGLCVWTNGGQILVSRSLPGVADSAAHTMLAELATLGKQASK